MQHRKSLAVAPLLVAAIAAPTAIAQPLESVPSTAHKFVVQQDLRSEAATSGSRAPIVRQDLRSEGATSGSRAPIVRQDLRSEAAADPSRAPKAPAGLPTWPLHPRPLTPVADQPVADGGDGVDWPVPVLAVIGTLLLGGSVAVVKIRDRTSHTPAAG